MLSANSDVATAPRVIAAVLWECTIVHITCHGTHVWLEKLRDSQNDTKAWLDSVAVTSLFGVQGQERQV